MPSDRYDCFVNQFTMHLIYDAQAALYHSIRILKPGGVLLINFSCVDYYFPRGLRHGHRRSHVPISLVSLQFRLRICSETSDCVRRITPSIYMAIYLPASPIRLNMAAEELTRRELEYADAGPSIIDLRTSGQTGRLASGQARLCTPWKPGITPAQWNSVTGHYGT